MNPSLAPWKLWNALTPKQDGLVRTFFFKRMTTWPRPLFILKVCTSSTRLGLRAFQSFSNLPVFWITTNMWRSFIFRNFATYFSFHNFYNFSTDSACPTHSHQLLFTWPGDNFIPWHFRHYMITTEHWTFSEMSSEMQDCLFPNLGIFRNMKPTYVFLYFFFYIPFPERHTDSDALTKN